jgi:hypothetical protein
VNVGFSGPKTMIEEIIAAHGGSELWNSLDGLEARISAWVFLFEAKHLPVLELFSHTFSLNA